MIFFFKRNRKKIATTAIYIEHPLHLDDRLEKKKTGQRPVFFIRKEAW
jgi:hypothetical protein